MTELREAKAVIDRIENDLESEGLPFRKSMPIGVMIEASRAQPWKWTPPIPCAGYLREQFLDHLARAVSRNIHGTLLYNE